MWTICKLVNKVQSSLDGTFNSKCKDCTEVVQILWQSGNSEVDEEIHNPVEEEEGKHGHVLTVVNVRKFTILEARV